MPVTSNLGLTLQSEGASNYDDAIEDNWEIIDEALTLAGSGNPNGAVASIFPGQRYWDRTNRLTWIAATVGPASGSGAALWIIDDGCPVGTLRTVLSKLEPPPGWLAVNGQQLAVSNYPALAVALAGTGVTISSGLITLPNLANIHQLIHSNDGALVGAVAGDNTVATGGGQAASTAISTSAGGHNHSASTQPTSLISVGVASGTSNFAAPAAHTHSVTLEAASAHSHNVPIPAIPAHTHSLSLRTMKVRILIKAF